ncbi:SUKH-3 domain-containing protein [Myxococcus fulvus]|uniref:SUKH-3 domain-containing protein n=1 Tax=Myxococcus TaxID=32 RepID=UPI0020C02827|nr:SUKH-3 domain-containing protein [Myxococcus fulvus]MCK8499503.1 SUKH-3 domain-containing protein [Myxococcus fulvus]
MELSEIAKQRLSAAGWTPGRDVSGKLSKWVHTLREKGGFEVFPAAERVLREFGGLSVEQRGPGVTSARESFSLDPLLGVNGRRMFGRYAEFLGVSLYPLGTAFAGDMYLVVAEDDRVFGIGEEAWLVGRGIVEALDTLLVGRMLTSLGGPARR